MKDALLEHLQKAEGKEFRVIGEDVPNRTGTKNFDYLVREEPNRHTLAIDVTLIADHPHEFE